MTSTPTPPTRSSEFPPSTHHSNPGYPMILRAGNTGLVRKSSVRTRSEIDEAHKGKNDPVYHTRFGNIEIVLRK
eukprot:452740-Rhodomonas_salina.1